MGASHWWYDIVYDTDTETTVTRLRDRVFANHDYMWDGDSDQARPETIDELLEAQEDEGTHSILDIRRIDDQPDFAVLSPLTDEELTQFFGTTTPSYIQAITWAESAELARSVGEGAYVIVRDATGRPQNMIISGASGD